MSSEASREEIDLVRDDENETNVGCEEFVSGLKCDAILQKSSEDVRPGSEAKGMSERSK